MNLLSVNVGLPRTVIWREQEVRTGIFKQAVTGRVPVQAVNLQGDGQADLTVHGGPDKSVYCYAFEHYDYWSQQLPGWPLEPGVFGENLTTVGLPEESVHIGDRFRVGTAELVVTQPRLPCFKLGLRFQSEDMVQRFLAAGRMGFYVTVAKEGELGAGDRIEVVSRDPDALGVSEVLPLHVVRHYGPAEAQLARRALQVKALARSWKEHLTRKLAAIESETTSDL